MDVSTARNLIASGVASMINDTPEVAIAQFSAEIDALAEQVAAHVAAPIETKDEEPVAAVEDSAAEITVSLAPHSEADAEAATMAIAAGEQAAEI